MQNFRALSTSFRPVATFPDGVAHLVAGPDARLHALTALEQEPDRTWRTVRTLPLEH